MKAFLAKLQRLGPLAQSAWLALAVGAAWAVVGPPAAVFGGAEGFWASAVAAGLCLAGATLALLVGHWLRGPRGWIPAVLLGMIARLGVPLGGGLAVQLASRPLGSAGLLYYLLMFYPVSLAAEVFLSLGTVGRPGSAPR